MFYVLQSTTAARNAFKYVLKGMLSYGSGRICLAISCDNGTKVGKNLQKTNGIRGTESGLFWKGLFRGGLFPENECDFLPESGHDTGILNPGIFMPVNCN